MSSATIANGASRTSTPDQRNDPAKPTVIAVFCGSSPGTSPTHMAAAKALAHHFHTCNIHLVYGGGTVGLMGEVARTLVSLSGPKSVHGVIPNALIQYEQSDREKPDPEIYGITTIVIDMHERKAMMAREVIEGGPGSGFVALSGGFGTMEEIMEMVTWCQLGIHGRGVVVYNVDGYYDHLLRWVEGAVGAGFISGTNAGILVEARSPEEVVEKLKDYQLSEGRLNLNWSQK